MCLVFGIDYILVAIAMYLFKKSDFVKLAVLLLCIELRGQLVELLGNQAVRHAIGRVTGVNVDVPIVNDSNDDALELAHKLHGVYHLPHAEEENWFMWLWLKIVEFFNVVFG